VSLFVHVFVGAHDTSVIAEACQFHPKTDRGIGELGGFFVVMKIKPEKAEKIFERDHDEFFSSLALITTEQAMSPVIFVMVRNMSGIRSTPMMKAIPSRGIPICLRTMARVIMPAAGTPAAPIEDRVAIKTIVI
jgi:hypothetical protein